MYIFVKVSSKLHISLILDPKMHASVDKVSIFIARRGSLERSFTFGPGTEMSGGSRTFRTHTFFRAPKIFPAYQVTLIFKLGSR